MSHLSVAIRSRVLWSRLMPARVGERAHRSGFDDLNQVVADYGR
jgi:hypothetical protein